MDDSSQSGGNDAGVVSQVQYILLVRHASRIKPYDIGRETHPVENDDYEPRLIEGMKVADRKMEGKGKALSLGGWVAEVLALRGICVTKILSSSHMHAKQTADFYRDALQPQQCCDPVEIELKESLSPEVFWGDAQAAQSLLAGVEPAANGKALLISGHQPQLTWIAQACRTRFWRCPDKVSPKRPFGALAKLWWSCWRRMHALLPPTPLPIGQAECVCVRLAPSCAIVWAVAADDPALTVALREKLARKMDVCKLQISSLAILIGLVAQKVPTSDRFLQVGAALLLMSLLQCLLCFVALDRLSMPSKFWSDGHPKRNSRAKWLDLQRPPTQTHWILFFSMIKTWNTHYIPAALTLLLGLNFVTFSVLQHDVSAMLVALSAQLLVFVLYRVNRVALGFDD